VSLIAKGSSLKNVSPDGDDAEHWVHRMATRWI
jgi:hypothetical protein